MTQRVMNKTFRDGNLKSILRDITDAIQGSTDSITENRGLHVQIEWTEPHEQNVRIRRTVRPGAEIVIPNYAQKCTYGEPCPYRGFSGICDQPQTAQGNSDASCTGLLDYTLIKFLEKP